MLRVFLLRRFVEAKPGSFRRRFGGGVGIGHAIRLAVPIGEVEGVMQKRPALNKLTPIDIPSARKLTPV